MCRYPFRFANTELTENEVSVDGSGGQRGEHRGKIELKVYPARAVPNTFLYKDVRPASQQIVKKETGKKFWKLPSVATTYDDSNPLPYTKPEINYLTTSNIPIATTAIYYHSPGTIAILKQIAEENTTTTNRHATSSPPTSSSSAVSASSSNKDSNSNGKKHSYYDCDLSQSDDNPGKGGKRRKHGNEGPILIDLINNTVHQMKTTIISVEE